MRPHISVLAALTAVIVGVFATLPTPAHADTVI